MFKPLIELFKNFLFHYNNSTELRIFCGGRSGFQLHFRNKGYESSLFLIKE